MSDDRILIIKHGALGDIVLATAAMKAIRTHHQGDRITLLTRPEFESIFASCPFVNDLIIDSRPKVWQLSKIIMLRRQLLRPRFRRVYDLQTSRRTRAYYALMGPGPRPEWCGNLINVQTGFYEPIRNEMHPLDVHREQLRRVGILSVPEPDVRWAASPLPGASLSPPTLVLVPGGSAHRPEKRWPKQNYAELAHAAEEMGFQVLIVGSIGERFLAEAIHAVCPAAVDLTGKTTIGNLVWLAGQVTHVVGNDTGPMHVFAAAGTPATVLYSKNSDPDRAAPRGKHVSVIQRPQLEELDLATVLNVVREQTKMVLQNRL